MSANEANATALLGAAVQGDAQATTSFAALVYDALRDRARGLMSRERPDHTLQPTALVNEAYVRLLGNSQIDWKSRTHFFAVAARQMRRILIDAGRRRPKGQKLTLIADALGGESRLIDILSLDEALKLLAEHDEREASVVELKFFGGMTEPDVARALGVSERTVRNDWRHARVWLWERMGGEVK